MYTGRPASVPTRVALAVQVSGTRAVPRRGRREAVTGGRSTKQRSKGNGVGAGAPTRRRQADIARSPSEKKSAKSAQTCVITSHAVRLTTPLSHSIASIDDHVKKLIIKAHTEPLERPASAARPPDRNRRWAEFSLSVSVSVSLSLVGLRRGFCSDPAARHVPTPSRRRVTAAASLATRTLTRQYALRALSLGSLPYRSKLHG